MLPDGEQVGQHLAGVAEVGQAVDDGNFGVLGQPLHLLLGKGADHDAVAVPVQHPGGVLNGLPSADLTLLAGEEQGMAPQLVHPRLEGDTGAGGVLLKDHGQGLALEVVLVDVVLGLIFQLVRRVQDGDDILPGQVQQL